MNKKQLDIIYTDYAKAFDKMDHWILLDKQVNSDCKQFHKNLFTKYLDKFIATLEMPQGSNLIPLLFIVVINYVIASWFMSSILVYADDFMLIRAILSVEDCDKMQSDLYYVGNGLP